MNGNISQQDVEDLIHKAYRILKEKDPNHNLLKFFFINEKYIILKYEQRKKYYKRFSPKISNNSYNHRLGVPNLIRYYQALEKAVLSLEKIVDN